MRKLVMALGMLWLAGCATVDYRYTEAETEQLMREIIGDVTPPNPETLPTLALPDEARRILDEKISDRWHDGYRLDKLRELLFDEDQMDISYNATQTLTASEVWERGSGNCLGMTNLFVAAARHIGINAGYRTVDVEPTWDHSGATMVRYEHILATGRLRSGNEYVMDFLPEFVLGERDSKAVSDLHAYKLYRSNLGAEMLLEGDADLAVEHLRMALAIDDGFADGWNNMGAALRRQGRADLAEFAFQRSLYLNGNLSALSNLVQLYENEGRGKEAEKFRKRVLRYRARNPYFNFHIARLFYQMGQLRNTVFFLEESIRLKRDEPKFYAAMSEVYAALGDEAGSVRYAALATKYEQELRDRGPPRERNHHFFIQTLSVN